MNLIKPSLPDDPEDSSYSLKERRVFLAALVSVVVSGSGCGGGDEEEKSGVIGKKELPLIPHTLEEGLFLQPSHAEFQEVVCASINGASFLRGAMIQSFTISFSHPIAGYCIKIGGREYVRGGPVHTPIQCNLQVFLGLEERITIEVLPKPINSAHESEFITTISDMIIGDSNSHTNNTDLDKSVKKWVEKAKSDFSVRLVHRALMQILPVQAAETQTEDFSLSSPNSNLPPGASKWNLILYRQGPLVENIKITSTAKDLPNSIRIRLYGDLYTLNKTGEGEYQMGFKRFEFESGSHPLLILEGQQLTKGLCYIEINYRIGNGATLFFKSQL